MHLAFGVRLETLKRFLVNSECAEISFTLSGQKTQVFRECRALLLGIKSRLPVCKRLSEKYNKFVKSCKPVSVFLQMSDNNAHSF